MRRTRFFGSMMRYGAVAAAVLAIAGCGGGGGDGGGDGAATIDVTASNKDTVARAAVVALRGGAELNFAGGVAGGPAIVAKGTRDAMAAVLRAGNVLSSREAPQALIDLGDMAADFCPGGGTAPATLDDGNNNGSWDAGEWVTVGLTDCLQDDGSVVKGKLGVANFQYTPSSISFDARMTGLEFTAVSGGSATYTGAFGYAQEATTARMTVAGSLAIGIVHPQYTDTVTLQDRYALVMTVASGQTTLQANGNIRSEQAGGTVVLRTREDIVVGDSELYPRAGRIEALGRKGSVTLTALSTSQVQIDFDQGDGAPYEDTTVVNWDFFLF
jgi:hypothetical protein